MLVPERHGQPVELELADQLRFGQAHLAAALGFARLTGVLVVEQCRLGRSETAHDTAMPCPKLVKIHGVVERPHRPGMDDLAEQRRQLGADTLAGRVRIREFGVARFEFDELALAGVILPIGHRRRVVAVVLDVVAVDQARQVPHAVEITLPALRRLFAIVVDGGCRSLGAARGWRFHRCDATEPV